MSVYLPISEFYTGKSIFVTGGTGFLGKTLIEKLLRSCPKLKHLFILVRPKRGKSVQERVDELFNCKLFDTLRNSNPSFADPIVAVAGDILEPALAISEADRQRLVEEVSIVFHSAATVRFDDPLRIAVRMNIEGTKKVVDLALQLRKLEAFVHVSTAYCNCDRNHVEELVYPPTLQPQKLIDAVEWMDEEMMDKLTPSLLMTKPNTYTFTKNLAEYLIVDMMKDLPVSIVRPSIVGASWREPVKGWVDNFNGPSGLMAALSKGLLRSMVGDESATADIVPVDSVVNLLLAAAWDTALNSNHTVEDPAVCDGAVSRVPVYNCTSGQLARRNGKPHRFTWGEMEQLSQEYFKKNPVDGCIRVPKAKFTTNSLTHNVRWIFDHQLPAALLDLYMYVSGRRAIFVRVNQKLQKSIRSLDYFTSNQWVFSNENLLGLHEKLSSADKKEFNFDVRKLNWNSYIEDYCLGLKEFAMKEDMTGLDKARAKMKRLQRLSYIFNAILVIVVWRLLVKRVKVAHNMWQLMLNLAVNLFTKVPRFARS